MTDPTELNHDPDEPTTIPDPQAHVRDDDVQIDPLTGHPVEQPSGGETA